LSSGIPTSDYCYLIPTVLLEPSTAAQAAVNAVSATLQTSALRVSNYVVILLDTANMTTYWSESILRVL